MVPVELHEREGVSLKQAVEKEVELWREEKSDEPMLTEGREGEQGRRREGEEEKEVSSNGFLSGEKGTVES